MDFQLMKQYGNKGQFLAELKRRVIDSEVKHHGCAQIIVTTFLDMLGEDNELVSMASSPFAAGLALTGNNCGALVGGLMVLGMAYGRRDNTEGMEGILRGIKPMRKLVKAFQERQGHLNCREITGTDLADPAKAQAFFDGGGLERCAHMMADVAAFVGDILYEDKVQQGGSR